MGRREFYEEERIKRIASIFSITLILSIVIFLTIFVMYNKKLKENSSSNIESLGKINEIVSNEEIEQTSFSSDKTIEKNNINTIDNATSEKSKNKKKVNTTPIQSKIENVTNTSNIKNNTSNDNNISNNTLNENSNTIFSDKISELKFVAPVSGEILKDFAIENLLYSKTLEEWITHTGIDIKADKTTVVKAAEAGTVESIKNDPRYGLTVTIIHENGFKTVYSNLLTTEFVSEGEVVEKGETIATVGETASFEVADEPHLHFEMYKNNEVVNPTIYLK